MKKLLMIFNVKKLILLTLFMLLALPEGVPGVTLKSDKIGDYVRSSDFVIYGDLHISEIKEDGEIVAKLKPIEVIKGKLDKEGIDVSVFIRSPENTKKLNSDLTNLNISASEDIERNGTSIKRVVMMLKQEGEKYVFLRIITLFRPDKLDIYLESYKEIVSMTKLNDKKKLLETIKYNLGEEEFSFSLYNHCINELFDLDIGFKELFSTVKEFLVLKGEKKVHSWFKVFLKSGKRLFKDYDAVDEDTRDSFFSYFYESYVNEPIESEYTNKRFLELIYDLRRLLIKSPKWQKKFHKAVKERNVTLKGLAEDHFRNIELNKLKEKVVRSLSK